MAGAATGEGFVRGAIGPGFAAVGCVVLDGVDETEDVFETTADLGRTRAEIFFLAATGGAAVVAGEAVLEVVS